MSRRLSFNAAGRTDIGRVRETNQDTLLLRPDLGLFVVCDGIGGHAAGEVAAALAATAIEGFIEDLGTTWPLDARGAPTDALARLVTAVHHANKHVYDTAAKDRRQRGMGTTVVAGLLRENTICLAHVGDSRIHRFRDGQLEQLTEDHTVCNEWIRQGMDAALAQRLPTGAALSRAVGTYPTVVVSARAETVLPGDVLLLTSDGVHRVVPADEIARALTELSDLTAGVERLITRANEGGGPDNSTAILVRWDR